MFEPLPAPPWNVEGFTVCLEKNSERKELKILVDAEQLAEAFGRTSEDKRLSALLLFVEITRARFERVVPPGWTVLA